MSRKVSRSVEADLITNIVPSCLYWDVEDVAQWVEDSGFPMYSICFRKNFINGRKLIVMDCSALPAMGINDFEDIKKLTQAIRDLLGIEKVKKREISMRDPKYAYIEIKRRTGTKTDHLTYNDFVRQNRVFFPTECQSRKPSC